MKSSTLIPNPPRRSPWHLSRAIPSACLLLPLLPLARAQQTASPPPPPSPAVVARVTAAKTIFLSNAGANDSFNGEIPGGPNVTYNELYAALQQWGYFQLVDSPAHADLIFQIRGTETAPNLAQTVEGYIVAQQHAPRFELSILDPTSPSTPLDTITARAGRGTNLAKGTIALAQSVEWLTYQISTRVSAPRATHGKLLSRDALRPSFETLIHFTAPIPTQVLHAKTVFLQTDPVIPKEKSDHDAKAFTAALTTWGYYHLSGTPNSADLLLHYHDDLTNGTYLTLEDPATKTILWTLTDPHHGFYRQSGDRRISALNQNLISQLKQLNQIPLTQAETAALH